MMKKNNYNSPLSKYEDLMTKKHFLECCEIGCFIDADGFGYPVKDNLMDETFEVVPSKRKAIPRDATHIIWFNK